MKLDGSECPAVAVDRLGVSGVPALIAFRGGVEVGRKVGFLPEPRLRKWLDELTEDA